MRHPEDSTHYERLLEATRDNEGVCHRNEAVKLLTEALTNQPERTTEYATARAQQVADGFDKQHQPETQNGQMALDVDTYLVIGDSERVAVTQATPTHTRRWLDIANIAKAKHDAAHAAKTLHGYRLLEIQDQHECSLWDAEQILRGE